MSFFRSCCAPFFRCIGGAADNQPQQHEHLPQASLHEMLGKMQAMQHKIEKHTCQIEQLRKEQRAADEEIKQLNEKKKVTYSPNYVHEEAERIEGFITEENLQESETVATRDQLVSPRFNDDENYKMNHKNRGQLHIFIHEIFKNRDLSPRKDTEKIVNQVRETFKKVKFEVTIHKDLTAKKIERVLDDLTAKDFTNDDCICIYVSTHGENGILWALDYGYSDNIFADKLCQIRSLVNKPKIIFIEACRGPNVDKGLSIESSGESSDEVDFVINCNKTPTKADTFVIYSTLPGFTSFRSWMMPTFCDMMDKHGDEDLISILTRTNNKISKYESNSDKINYDKAKQTCYLAIIPRKKIYFR